MLFFHPKEPQKTGKKRCLFAPSVFQSFFNFGKLYNWLREELNSSDWLKGEGVSKKRDDQKTTYFQAVLHYLHVW